jgi:hypothetical protein
MTKGTLFRGLLALGLTWGLVAAVVSWTAERKATPEKVADALEEGDFEDWSEREEAEMPPETREARKEKIEELVAMISQLDLRQRKEISGAEELLSLFSRLSPKEKVELVDLLFNKNAKRIMALFDRLGPEAREKMIERAMREMTEGKGADALARLKETDPELVDLVVRKGIKAYFLEASVETKMALLPFMDAVGEMVQGFGKPRAEGL